MEIDHEMITTVIVLPSADSRRVVVSYKRKYVQEVLVKCLVKLSQEKSVVRNPEDRFSRVKTHTMEGLTSLYIIINNRDIVS